MPSPSIGNFWHSSTNRIIPDESGTNIGREIKALREARGMTQGQLAAAIGVNVGTVSRWERGERTPMGREYQKAIRVLRAAPQYGSQHGLGTNVPRGTSAPAPRPGPPHELPRQLRLMALDFEREALSVGADEAFLRYVRSAFSDPDFTALFGGGPDESPMTPEEEREEMQAVVAEMRALLMVRLRHARERNPSLDPELGGKDMRMDENADPPPGRRRIGEVIPDPRIAAAEAEREANEAAKARRNRA